MVIDPNNPCLFCNSKKSGIARENELAYASYDTYPVSNLHCLIISKRHVSSYFDLTNEEKLELIEATELVTAHVDAKDLTIDGYNIGINVGEEAGQTVMHFHQHRINESEYIRNSLQKCLHADMRNNQKNHPKKVVRL